MIRGWLFIKDIARSMTTLGWVVLALVIALALLVATCAEQDARDARHAEREAKARAALQERARKADGAASDQRRIDTIIIHQNEKALTDAVKDLPDARPGPRRVALACQRLRNQGIAETDLPAECRSGG